MQILPNSSESVTKAVELDWLAALAACYPAFAKVRPLAIGIHAEILADWPEVDPNTLKAALKRYARSFQYRKALERKKSRRIHLDGSDAGEVDEQHRQPLYPRKKPKPSPQSQTLPVPAAPSAPEPVASPPVDTKPPDPGIHTLLRDLQARKALPTIPQDMRRRLIQLCHPDRHEGSEASRIATQWLLEGKA